jgi:hypothetical protein
MFFKKSSITINTNRQIKITIVFVLNLFFSFKYEIDATTPAMGKKNKNFFLSNRDETDSLFAFVMYIDSKILVMTYS